MFSEDVAVFCPPSVYRNAPHTFLDVVCEVAWCETSRRSLSRKSRIWASESPSAIGSSFILKNRILNIRSSCTHLILLRCMPELAGFAGFFSSVSSLLRFLWRFRDLDFSRDLSLFEDFSITSSLPFALSCPCVSYQIACSQAFRAHCWSLCSLYLCPLELYNLWVVPLMPAAFYHKSTRTGESTLNTIRIAWMLRFS